MPSHTGAPVKPAPLPPWAVVVDDLLMIAHRRLTAEYLPNGKHYQAAALLNIDQARAGLRRAALGGGR